MYCCKPLQHTHRHTYARARNISDQQIAQCQSACCDGTTLGHVIAILEVGSTTHLNTPALQQLWETRAFLPAAKLSGKHVTEIVRVYPFAKPWLFRGAQRVFHVDVQVDNLPVDLDPQILQRSVVQSELSVDE